MWSSNTWNYFLNLSPWFQFGLRSVSPGSVVATPTGLLEKVSLSCSPAKLFHVTLNAGTFLKAEPQTAVVKVLFALLLSVLRLWEG